jgi:hypothetical protein
MDLSIRRSTAFFAVVIVVAGVWWLRSGGAEKLPEPLREALPPEVTGPAPELPEMPKTRRTAPRQEPAPVEGTTEAPPKRPERTPDEKARGLLSLAESYAENGRFDVAFAKLEEAEALGPTDPVKAELRAAQERITALMRSRR